ncbi:MAG: hypothetical protein VKO39_13230 [Cyanobacteriota bacterium]|nr:hypothetical protein [Cyanobacteriota bacterium]
MVLIFAPALILFLCFLLRVLAELRSGLWEPDLDYLMVVADQWLAGRPPWIFDFDDKLPLTYVFFLPAALAGSIRVFQLEATLIIMAGAACVASIIRDRIRSTRILPDQLVLAISLFGFSLFCYCIAFCASSINATNGLAASFFAAGAALLFFIVQRHRILSLHALPALMLAALLVAVAVSLRPYFFLPSLALIVWVYLASEKRFSYTLIPVGVVWSASLAGSGFLLNYLPYLVSGHSRAFFSGLEILSQKLIPSVLQEVVKRQFYDVLSLPDIIFFCLTSCFLLALIVFFPSKRLPLFLRPSDRLAKVNATIRCDAFFWGLFFNILLELLILKKHYYPHYLQFFVPFAAISFCWLVAIVAATVQPLARVMKLRLLMIAIIIFLALLRTDFAFAARDLLFPVLDTRTAEYVTFKSDPTVAARLRKGFLYPESMSAHWRLHSPRFGFPNTFSMQLIDEGAWRYLKMPAYFNLPTTPEALCERLRESGPATIITKTESFARCLENDPNKNYKLLPSVDHSLIRVAIDALKIPPYTVRMYERLTAPAKSPYPSGTGSH